MWMNLKKMMLSEISQTEKNHYCMILILGTSIVQFIKTENRMVVARD